MNTGCLRAGQPFGGGGGMFKVPLGIFGNPAMPYVRVGSYLPMLTVLALVFVIPHDKSTRLSPDLVGADGFAVTPTLRRGLAERDAFLQQQRPAKVLLRAARMAARRTATGGVSWEMLSPPPSPTLPSPTLNHSFTSVEELRDFYGPRQNWWGDYNARETRELYHSLLPTRLLDAEYVYPGAHTVEERARMAVAAPRAAKMYAGERGLLPVSLASQLLDGVRVFCAKSTRGTWQPDGLSEEQILAKYAEKFGVDLHGTETVPDEVYYTILRKSCTSNFYVDSLVGLAESSGEFGI